MDDSKTIAAGRESTLPATVEPNPLSAIQKPPRNPLEGKVVPSERQSRMIVLCFDGTGDKFDADNSNVVQLFETLKKDDQSKQMVYYQSGIGTYTTPFIITPILTKLSKIFDEAIAWNLDAHVTEGYEFLMQHYNTGDRICLFGFSRGGYTVRALAGLVHKVGLLPAGNRRQIPVAFKLFDRTDAIGWEQSVAFKRAFCNDVDIEFIGIWDTVGSVASKLPFTTSNTSVRNVRHALALDERRAKFKANMFSRPSPLEARLGTSRDTAGSPAVDGTLTAEGKVPQQITLELEGRHERDLDVPTDVEEVWFAGCHCDVGGGSVKNGTKYALARIPLRWMIRECFKTQTGIMFDAEKLQQIGLDPSSLSPHIKPRPLPLPAIGQKILTVKEAVPEQSDDDIRTEEYEELRDALSPAYDQLSLQKGWWVLEYLPFRERYQLPDGLWARRYRLNRGAPRLIRSMRDGVKVHRSVRTRMEAEYKDGKGKYKPRAKFLDDLIWVD